MSNRSDTQAMMQIRLPRDLYARLRQAAADDSRSTTGLVRWLVEQYLRQRIAAKPTESDQTDVSPGGSQP